MNKDEAVIIIDTMQEYEDKYLISLFKEACLFEKDSHLRPEIKVFVDKIFNKFPHLNVHAEDVCKLIVCEMTSRYVDEQITYGVRRKEVLDLFYV